MMKKLNPNPLLNLLPGLNNNLTCAVVACGAR